ncbi:hypothetical protein ACSQ67_008470 [Phaseolus vulgaris]
MLIGGYDRYLDMYYSYISPNNAIQVCSPNPIMHSDFRLLFQQLRKKKKHVRRESSIHFSFRNKFPKIAVCCLTSAVFQKGLMAMNFKFRVFINESMQFIALSNFIERNRKTTLWCDVEGKVDGVFSEQEWNKVEIVFELGFPMQRNRGNESATLSFLRASLDWTLIGVYEEGNNKEDIEFKDPMSIFPLRSTSLPTSLYYVVV